MQRRNFLVGLGSASVGGSALLGSGAFSRVESQRSVSVSVAEDHEAYLGLDKCPTPNGSYAWPDDHGHLEVLMSPDNPTRTENGGDTPLGAGINSNSTSRFDRVFQICNNGKDTVCVHIEDDIAWPTVPETEETDVGERRVEFYLEANDDVSLIGVDNSIPISVGQCVCVGVKTRSYGLQNDDELLEALDNEIRIIADVDGDCIPSSGCADLSVEYESTNYDDEGGTFRRQGTVFRVTNTNGVPTSYDLAVANEPGDWRSGLGIDDATSQTRTIDASVPTAALVFWPCGNGAPDGSQTWGEYKEANDFADLEDWYEQTGTTQFAPSGSPQDVDDTLLVVEATNIPDGEPDEEIDAGDFPDMSAGAEAEGWITTEKFNA